MILVLVILAVVWGTGALLGTPKRPRYVMVGAILAVVIVMQLALPDGHPLRQATGGDARLWALLAGFALLATAYRQGLRWLRARARPAPPPPAPQTPKPAFEDDELRRYARHMMLRDIGGQGQKRLKNGSVLIVGAGGLGAPALLYLGAAGVGRIGVVDFDTVDLSNLQRQVIHAEDEIDQPKVASAARAIARLNRHVAVDQHDVMLSAENAPALFARYDLILDGSDNFDTRFMVNEAAVRAGKPLISGAIAQWEGQVGLYHPATGSACYRCAFPEAPPPGIVPSCAEAGVAGPLPGIIGSVMALEAVKWFTGAGESLAGRMLVWDGLYTDARVMRINRREDCQTCGRSH